MMFSSRELDVFRNTLRVHIWMVTLNHRAPQLLYTSDTPVVLQSHNKSIGPGGVPLGVGLGSPYIEIAFPLDPKHVLIMFDRVGFKEHTYLDCRCVRLDASNISYYTSLQVLRSYRQVYAPVDDFDLARDVCERFRGVRDPGRKRGFGMNEEWPIGE